MRYTLSLSQSRLVDCGLLHKIDLKPLLLLDYLKDWQSSPKRKTLTRGNRVLTWIDYPNAARELPVLFSPDSSAGTRANQLCAMMKRLHAVELIVTAKGERGRLFFALTDLGKRLAFDSDDTGTQKRENTLTEKREIPISKEQGTKGTSPPSPPEGEEEFWIKIVFECIRLPARQLTTRERRALLRSLPLLDRSGARGLVRFYRDEPANTREKPFTARKLKPQSLFRDLPTQLALAATLYPPPPPPKPEPDGWRDAARACYPNPQIPASFHELPTSVQRELIDWIERRRSRSEPDAPLSPDTARETGSEPSDRAS